MVSYVLSDKMLPKSYEEAIKQTSSGTPTVIFFGAFYAGAIFFFPIFKPSPSLPSVPPEYRKWFQCLRMV